MDITKEVNTNSAIFKALTDDIAIKGGIQFLQSKQSAINFINSIDKIMDLRQGVYKTASNEEIEGDVLLFGSAFGEALKVCFGGEWLFSGKQQRWVIQTNKGDNIIEMNTFNKIDKRIRNGEEDSVSYYLANIISLFDGTSRL